MAKPIHAIVAAAKAAVREVTAMGSPRSFDNLAPIRHAKQRGRPHSIWGFRLVFFAPALSTLIGRLKRAT